MCLCVCASHAVRCALTETVLSDIWAVKFENCFDFSFFLALYNTHTRIHVSYLFWSHFPNMIEIDLQIELVWNFFKGPVKIENGFNINFDLCYCQNPVNVRKNKRICRSRRADKQTNGWMKEKKLNESRHKRNEYIRIKCDKPYVCNVMCDRKMPSNE